MLLQALCGCSPSTLAAAGIPWLLAKYKGYVVLRERLMSDSVILRKKLDSAAPDIGSSSPAQAQGTGAQADGLT